MVAKTKCVLCGLIAVVAVAWATADAAAQCSTCATPTMAYYQPAPVVVAPVRTGWYPGYWMDRTRMAFWGPRQVTVARPVMWSAGYAPTTFVSSGCSTCAAYAPACSSCAPSGCTTCARPVTLMQQVTLRPICGCAPACTSCASPCTGCSDCGTGCASCGSGCSSCSGTAVAPAEVSPAVYSAPAAAPCTNCGMSTEAAQPVGPAPSTYAPQQPLQPQPQQPQQPQPQTQQPTLSPSDNPAPERTLLNKPTNGSDEPTPATETHEHKDESSANYLEAPQLFNPSDRTAQRVAAPVWNAVYHQEASADNQLEADAAGWTSASN